nr:MAG TPA_asm: hypothetical protein [Caudoviricetes sp.]
MLTKPGAKAGWGLPSPWCSRPPSRMGRNTPQVWKKSGH